MKSIKEQIINDFTETIRCLYGFTQFTILIRENEAIASFDYQVDIAFVLAKLLKANPNEIAEKVISSLKRQDIYQQIQVSKPGFINIKINQEFIQLYLSNLLNDQQLGVVLSNDPQTIVVDYASPNVAKEMHVGHLRSSIIGDSISRILSFLGHKVIKQNHIGDWGTQFGFLIQYIIEKKLSFTNISDINKAYKEAREVFDNDKEFAIRSKERLVLLQSADDYTVSIWKDLSKLSYKHFNEVFNKLGVLLKDEDVRGESFYNFMLNDIVAELYDNGVAEKSDGAMVIFLPGFFDKENSPVPMIIQKSDDGYLYHTTDLAAAKYRINDLKANRIIYVTDARQKQHFEMLFGALKKTAWIKNNSVVLNHVAFGTVLGEDKKPFKTRSGDTISLVSVLDEAEYKAKEGVKNKYPLINDNELNIMGNAIGIGALKYADLSSDIAKDYVFSWERMLSFNGNTAPYLQNAYVRIKSIFRKENSDFSNARDNSIIITNNEEKKLCLKISEFSEVIKSIEEKLTPHILCNYLYELASLFHHFYETCPIGKCDEQRVKSSRLSVCVLTADSLKKGLDLLGINVIDKM